MEKRGGKAALCLSMSFQILLRRADVQLWWGDVAVRDWRYFKGGCLVCKSRAIEIRSQALLWGSIYLWEPVRQSNGTVVVTELWLIINNYYLFCFVFVLFLNMILFYIQGWPQTLSTLPTSASWVLGWEVCTITPGSSFYFHPYSISLLLWLYPAEFSAARN